MHALSLHSLIRLFERIARSSSAHLDSRKMPMGTTGMIIAVSWLKWNKPKLSPNELTTEAFREPGDVKQGLMDASKRLLSAHSLHPRC